MQNIPTHDIALTTSTSKTQTQVLTAIVAAVLLGASLLYTVAFAQNAYLHNAAHDVRHVMVKPCH